MILHLMHTPGYFFFLGFIIGLFIRIKRRPNNLNHDLGILLLFIINFMPHVSYFFFFWALYIISTHQKALRMVAAADRTAGFPLFSSLLSFPRCDRYRETKMQRLHLKKII